MAAQDVGAERALVKLAEELGLDLEQADHQGQTPFMKASTFGTELERKVLLGLGARRR